MRRMMCKLTDEKHDVYIAVSCHRTWNQERILALGNQLCGCQEVPQHPQIVVFLGLLKDNTMLDSFANRK